MARRRLKCAAVDPAAPRCETWVNDGLRAIGHFIAAEKGFDAFDAAGRPLGRHPKRRDAYQAILSADQAARNAPSPSARDADLAARRSSWLERKAGVGKDAAGVLAPLVFDQGGAR